MEKFIKTFKELNIDDLYEILRLRVDVFVVEQACSYKEIDGIDKKALHIYIKDEGEIIAYARLFKENDRIHIGRVIAKKRGQGLGKLVLKESIKAAIENYHAKKIHIEAQTYAREFYEKLGFIKTSEEFFLDGIEHIKMVLSIRD